MNPPSMAREIYDAGSLNLASEQAHPCSMTDAFSRRVIVRISFSESDADVPRPGQ